MPAVNEEWIAYRLAVLCADRAGVVRGGLTVRDHGVRAALLLDLAFRGRLDSRVDENYLDIRPTGFAPADALLRHVEVHPNRSVARVISSAPIGVVDVLDPSRAPAGWRRRKRSVRLDGSMVEQERRLVAAVAESGKTDSPSTAALAVVAGSLDLASVDQRAALVARCGPARALVADCATYLDDLMLRMTYVAESPGSGSG
jgi:hypothetical protein